MSLALTSTIYSPTAATFDAAAATDAALWVLLLPLRVFLFVVFIYFDYIFSIFSVFFFIFVPIKESTNKTEYVKE